MTKLQARPIRSDEELRDAASHINYESHMLLHSARRVGRYHASPPNIGKDEKNIHLEAFLLHFRNLHAFLCPLAWRPHPDDVVAGDFLNQTTLKDYASFPAFPNNEQQRLNGMLAHLSYRRRDYISSGREIWPVGEMFLAMAQQLGAFFEQCSESRRAWFTTIRFEPDPYAPGKIENLEIDGPRA